ncbi:MAG: HU family DNA-binding protein [Gammaproteobacteria bacterium]|nr:HU family DNA-binding protein [Gammaproteobacteria bacterium]
MAGDGREAGPSCCDRRQFRERYLHPCAAVAHYGLSMVKADLINRAAEATDLEPWVIRDAVDVLLESVGAALERGDRVVLRRFGLFHGAPRRTGVARNPRTNEPVDIPRGRVVRFRPAPGLSSIADGN